VSSLPRAYRLSPVQEKRKEDVVTWRRDAKRMLRASKKIAHDLLRSTRDQARAERPKPEKKNMKIYVTMNDRVGLPFLKYWNLTRRELHVGIEKGPWEIRKYLIRVYRLKGLQWVLYRKDLREGRWAELPKLLKIAEEGDEYQLEITGRKRRHLNTPGSSRKRHFDRPNSRKSKRDFIWSAPDPRSNAVTQVRLAGAGHIGYRDTQPEIESEERRRILESMQQHKEELLKDDRIKPTVGLSDGGSPESHEARRSLDLHEEQSEPPLTPKPPAVTAEARQAIMTLEIIAAEKGKLDERDERRRARHDEIQKKTRRPPPTEEEEPIKPKKKPPKVTKPQKAAQAEAKKQEKSEEGKARQAKAEQRTKKGKR
jgi:hypothetical protein